ncbi:ABC transporter permease [Corynebacterium variabile]|uniref:ABC transporter permease n=1 Tax=Corynebacterium variabile TaxID=1727 RepID=UPI003FD27969
MPTLTRVRSFGGGVLFLVGFLAVWWVLAATVLKGLGTIPTPGAILGQIGDDSLSFYWKNLQVTALEAVQGYLLGTISAVVLSMLVLLVPRLRGVVMQFAVITYSMPIIAIGPVFYLIVGAPASGEPSMTAVLLAALAIFFTTVVGSLLGLGAADPRALDVVDVFGGNRWTRLFKVQLIAAVPSILTALKLAAPIAVLGAILGEYVGGVDRGLGPALVNAQQTSDVERTWAIALVSAVLAGVWFALMSVVSTVVTSRGWGSDAVTTGVPESSGRRRWLTVCIDTVISVVLLCALWWGALRVLDVSTFVARSPSEVVQILTEGGEGRATLSALLPDLGQTLADTALGFIAGLCAAVLVAGLFLVLPTVERGLMPIAMFFQSVPLVAMAPVLIIIFGRGQITVAAMGGIIVFFPALVNIASAFKAVPTSLTELVQVYGASRLRELVMVRIPACVPAICAAVRIAIPGALSGALLAEWLATGRGIGFTIISAVGRSDTDTVWASVTVVTVAALILYGLAAGLETLTRRKWGTS